MKKYNLIWKKKCSHTEAMFWSLWLLCIKWIVQASANSLSSVSRYLTPKEYSVLSHPGFKIKRTGIPASIPEGSLLKVSLSFGILLP